MLILMYSNSMHKSYTKYMEAEEENEMENDK